jgi:predicted Zn-dependent peptidase
MGRFDPFDFEVEYTKDRIPVYVRNLPWIENWMEVRVVLNYGSLDDPVGKEGLAHLIEHLVFQGTQRFPTNKGILLDAKRKIFFDSLGGNTSYNRIYFSGRMIRSNAVKGFEVFRDLIFFPIFREADLIEEKKVVLAEMWERYLNAANIQAQVMLRKDLYGDHPMARNADPVLGDEETISGISMEDVVDSHRNNFHSGNLFFLFSGDVSPEEAIKLVEKFSEDVPKGPSKIPRVKPDHWPEPPVLIREIATGEYWKADMPGRATTRISVKRMLPKNENPYLNDIIEDVYGRLLEEKFRHDLRSTYGVRVSVEGMMDYDFLDIWLEVNPSEYQNVRSFLKNAIAQFGTRRGDKKFFEEVRAHGLNRSLISDVPIGRILEIAMNEIINNGRIYTREETNQFRQNVSFADISEYVLRELSADKLYWWVLMP